MRSSFAKSLMIGFIFSGLAGGCHRAGNHTEAAVDQTDSCRLNPAHTYQVFIPVRKKSGPKLPLLLAIDPHGSGRTAVDHLKSAATAYPAVLVASNLIRNNDAHFMQELDELIADVRNSFPVDKRIYLTGFSGGARMALAYAVRHPVDGLVLSGAFGDSDQLSAVKCRIMGLVGIDDFNFLETAPYILSPDRLPSNAHVELTRASHEWPAAYRLTNILGWFRLGDEADQIFGEQQVDLYVRAQQSRMDSLAGSGDLLEAACVSRNMGSVARFDKVGSFGSETARLINSDAYKQQLAQLAESLGLELKMREKYGPALVEQDEAWWKEEISGLHEKMNSEPEFATKMAYRRVSGFIGIFCYMYAKQFAEKRDVAHLEQILKIYRLAEPDNPDMKHFAEVLEQLKSAPVTQKPKN
jgi:pimeloyl-ACP methyl ester carboxylesterase